LTKRGGGSPPAFVRSLASSASGSQTREDVSPDGQRFLMIKRNTTGDQTSAPAGMIVVLNWLEELKQKLPAQ